MLSKHSMSDSSVDTVHAQVLAMNGSHRPFALPLLRAMHELGGAAKKKAVVERVRQSLENQIEANVFDELKRRGRFGFVRLELKHLGLVTGETGTWALTELGKRYVRARAADEIVIPEISLAVSPIDPEAPRETVTVSSYHAYEIPILEVLASGTSKTKEVGDAVGAMLRGKLLAGDQRRLPSGYVVWRYRTSWSLTFLGKSGHAVNVEAGAWLITDAGRQRLQRERDSWSFNGFPSSKATVLIEGPEPGPEPQPTIGGTTERWNDLSSRLPKDIAEPLYQRVRPDLGPTPASGSIARNVILYGPPGTGKTHVAKLVAKALAGEGVGSEARVRLVQFHPSYAYEDFVQGLKPDLTKTELRYALDHGPFLRIAEDAQNDPEHFYVLIIDEVNRGDPARIFGELLYALEYRDEPVVLSMGGELSVPSNLVIVGTMNSVDRSVALVDYALRRRFGFVRIDPDSRVIEQLHGDTLLGNAGPVVLEKFNDWLTRRLDREHVLGHSFFVSKTLAPESITTFERIWSLDVRPLLEEYFFGDLEGMKEASDAWSSIVAEATTEAAEEAAES